MVMHDYVRAVAGEVQRDGTAQAFGRAGDQSDFSSEVAGIRIGGWHRQIKKVAHSTLENGRQFGERRRGIANVQRRIGLDAEGC